MPKNLNILFLAAEAEPFVKVGGLGDVAGSLPRALRALSNDEIQVDARLVLPYHPVVKAEGLKPLGIFFLRRGEIESQVEAFETTHSGVPVYFLNGDPIRANGSVYSFDASQDTEKYAFFSLAALELPRRIGWTPNVLHANDWHTALSVYGALAQSWEEGARRAASVLTLHNLPYMGADASRVLESYGVKLAQTDLPEWARTLPLPLGLWAADAIVAVSPTYAQEILTPEYGCGLQEFLQLRGDSVSGILNGLDVESFNPATDSAIAVPFDSASLEKRAANKAALQEKLGLPASPETPLLAVVSRMDFQKGVDLALAALKSLMKTPWQAVILGSGDLKLEEAAAQLQRERPDRVKAVARYDATLARQIYAGADMLLMPSRYEPCGLAQMIAMRYGCVPIARAAGGLKDAIADGRTGFLFEKIHHLALAGAVKRAFKVFAEKDAWQAIQRAGMALDFSWENSAKQYLELYQSILKESVKV